MSDAGWGRTPAIVIDAEAPEAEGPALPRVIHVECTKCGHGKFVDVTPEALRRYEADRQAELAWRAKMLEINERAERLRTGRMTREERNAFASAEAEAEEAAQKRRAARDAEVAAVDSLAAQRLGSALNHEGPAGHRKDAQ